MSNRFCTNPDYLRPPDSFGLLEKGPCSCLDVANCLGKKCSCYHNSRIRAFARLRSLDEKKQEHIAKKYYGGRRPWVEYGQNHTEVKGQPPAQLGGARRLAGS